LAIGVALATSASAQNVAIVNGKAVPTTRMDAFVAQVVKQNQGKPMDDATRSQIREEVINREVFAQEAQKRGMDATDDFKNQIELARQSIMIREMFDDFNKKNRPTEMEVKAEYDKFAATNGGKEFKARHILVDKEEDAKKIIADVKKGGKFEDLAKKLSKDEGSGKQGGDLDWASAGSYVPEFSAAMVKLAKGKMTDAPVKSQFGWHVIRVDDVREGKLPPVAELKPQIEQKLMGDKMQAFQKGLRDSAKVE
jgi:peptidyl-prolyl cis-trans isomerase C